VILSIARHTVLNARSECSIVGCVTDATDASYCRHFRGGMSTHVLHSQSFTAHVGAATLQASQAVAADEGRVIRQLGLNLKVNVKRMC